ncbi:MAG: hypothetical protein AB1765_04945 [Candidatus Hydrogenedentota bacterium]
MIELSIKCPFCGQSLMDKEHLIDNCPGIKVIIEWKEKQGWAYLSALYGSYNTEYEFPRPKGEIGKFFCCHCKKELTSTRKCEECGAPMVRLDVMEGGILQICSRRGCKRHCIEFERLETELRAFYNAHGVL